MNDGKVDRVGGGIIGRSGVALEDKVGVGGG